MQQKHLLGRVTVEEEEEDPERSSSCILTKKNIKLPFLRLLPSPFPSIEVWADFSQCHFSDDEL